MEHVQNTMTEENNASSSRPTVGSTASIASAGSSSDAKGVACMKRLQQAINDHDLEALTQCFEPDYQSEFPAHPDRAFRGHESMRKNWTQIFASVPDMHSTLVRAVAAGETVWTEWEWNGTRLDGEPFNMRGVTIQTIPQDRITHAWLYMEPVQEAGPGPEVSARHALAAK